MRVGEALSKLKPIKGFVRAFESIEEILLTTHAAEGVISSLNTEIKELNKEISKTKDLLKSKEESLKIFLKEETIKRKVVEQKLLTMEAGFQEDRAHDEAVFKEEMEKNKKDNEVQILNGETKLALIHSEISEAEGILNGLKSAIEGLKEKIASV